MWGGVLEAIAILVAQHGECFAGTCGSIGEYGCIFA